MAVRFSGRWDTSSDKGIVFVDQDIRVFGPLINYLRAKWMETPGRYKSPPTVDTFDGNVELYGDFLRVVDFYGLTTSMYAAQIVPIDAGRHDAAAVTTPIMYVPNGVRFDHQQSNKQRYYLQSLVEGCRVASFEIVFEEDFWGDDHWKNFEIGWAPLDKIMQPGPSKEWYRTKRGKYTVWFFKGDRHLGGKVRCTLDKVACTGVCGDRKKYKMEFPFINVDSVAVFGGKGKWRLVNVVLEESTASSPGEFESDVDTTESDEEELKVFSSY